jgi:hypothetical protein
MAKAPKGWERIEPSRRKRPVRNGKRSSPPGKRRLHIKTTTETRIRDIIEGWEEPRITWEAVVQVVNVEFGGDWSRQALMKHKRIRNAYDIKKKELGGTVRDEEGDGTLEVLRRQIRDMREELAKLRAEKAKLLVKFATWKTNAYLNGWPIKALDKEPEKPDRGQTDKDRKR